MRKIITAGAVALAFVLTGCNSGEPGPKETVYVQQSPQDTSSSKEDRFVEAVRDEVPSASTLSDSEIVEFGETVCSTLDRGVSIREIGQIGLDNGLPPGEIGFLIGASVGALCPEHEQKVRNFIADNGGGNA